MRSGNGLVDESNVRGRLTRLMTRSPSAQEVSGNLDADAILESLDGAVIARSLDGIISAWNSGAERLYGYAADEAVGRPYDLIVPGICQDGESDTV